MALTPSSGPPPPNPQDVDMEGQQDRSSDDEEGDDDRIDQQMGDVSRWGGGGERGEGRRGTDPGAEGGTAAVRHEARG
jgi:hypothetical protein